MKSSWIAGSILLILPIAGCGGIGPRALDRDHLEYARAIADTQKQQTLLNVVRVRYADVPTFLLINQVVSNHSLQTAGTAGATVFPNASPATFGALTGSVQHTNNPIITFSPVSGAQLAGSLVRPLAPSELFPLAQNGLPIDVLLRLGVESIGHLDDTHRLENTSVTAGSKTTGSPAFFKLLADLKTLQDSGGLSFRFANDNHGTRVYLSISNGSDPTIAATAAQVRSLLGIRKGEVEIVYGRAATRPDQLAVLTRSFMGVLAHISSRIDVPIDDVKAHRTLASNIYAGEQKPLIVVRTGQTRPSNAFATVHYRERWFWVADTDIDSKIAFSIVQILMAIAQGEAHNATAPVLTISTGG